MIISDQNSNGPQFSKITTILCILLAALCVIIAPILAINFGLSETIATAIVAAGGTLGATAVVWNLKKSQAENTIKIYLSAYKEIVALKKENNEDVEEFLLDSENSLLQKMNTSIETSMEDATELIEKQEIL